MKLSVKSLHCCQPHMCFQPLSQQRGALQCCSEGLRGLQGPPWGWGRAPARICLREQGDTETPQHGLSPTQTCPNKSTALASGSATVKFYL